MITKWKREFARKDFLVATDFPSSYKILKRANRTISSNFTNFNWGSGSSFWELRTETLCQRFTLRSSESTLVIKPNFWCIGISGLVGSLVLVKSLAAMICSEEAQWRRSKKKLTPNMRRLIYSPSMTNLNTRRIISGEPNELQSRRSPDETAFEDFQFWVQILDLVSLFILLVRVEEFCGHKLVSQKFTFIQNLNTG